MAAKFLLIMVFIAPLMACRGSESDVAEHEYLLMTQSKCIVRTTANILKEDWEELKGSGLSEEKVLAIIFRSPAHFQCGPGLLLQRDGKLLDAFGDSVKFSVHGDSWIIYSSKTPFRLDDRKTAWGVKVTKDGFHEVEVDISTPVSFGTKD